MTTRRRAHARGVGLSVLLTLLAGALHARDGSWSEAFHLSDLDGAVGGLTSWNGGAGTRLVAVGGFRSAGPVLANHVAVWDGTCSSALGGGIPWEPAAPVCAASGADGAGPALFVGALFALDGGLPRADVARWDGGAWSALGPATAPGTDLAVAALAVVGRAVYAGGAFALAGGRPSAHLGRWSP